MPMIMLLCILPLLAGGAVEYAACRFPKGRFWRWLPPVATGAVTAVVAVVRSVGWSMKAGGGNAPIETLLIIPGIPAFLVFVGLFLGWRVWRRRWTPRIFREKKK